METTMDATPGTQPDAESLRRELIMLQARRKQVQALIELLGGYLTPEPLQEAIDQNRRKQRSCRRAG